MVFGLGGGGGGTSGGSSAVMSPQLQAAEAEVRERDKDRISS